MSMADTSIPSDGCVMDVFSTIPDKCRLGLMHCCCLVCVLCQQHTDQIEMFALQSQSPCL